jgi:hypothetical protein
VGAVAVLATNTRSVVAQSTAFGTSRLLQESRISNNDKGRAIAKLFIKNFTVKYNYIGQDLKTSFVKVKNVIDYGT